MMVDAVGGGGRDDVPGGFARMQEIFSSLPLGVAFLTGPDLVFQFANGEYRRYVGGRDLIGRPLREALPELPREHLEAVARAARIGRPFQNRESEVWIRQHGAESEQMFVDRLYQPVSDDAGGVAGVLICINDVTEHVRARRRLEVLADRLALTQERYRTLFETLPQGVVHYNADGTILGANPAARDILGLPPEAMTTWPIDRERRAVHEDGLPFREEDLPVVAAMRTGAVVADVVIGMPRGRTGELRWLKVTAVPDARDQQGRPQRVYAMFTDITEQRRAEAKVQQSNRLLGALRDANVLGVLVAGEDGRVLEANDAYLDIIGYSRKDLESGRISWRMLTPPQWAGRDKEALEQVQRAGACRPYEKDYIHRDGHRVPVLIGSAAISRHPLRGATFVVDLSGRQRREQERAALVEREQAARKEADTAKERLAFLLQAGDLVPATENRDDLVRQVSELVETAVTGRGDREADDLGQREARRAHQALRAINAELEERVALRTAELVKAEAERRAFETQLQQAERLQAIGQLTSGIAHDFGNLLAVIVGYTELAEDVSGDQDRELHRILGEIHDAADRAVHLSSDLLRFSSRARAKPEPIDLDALITSIADLLSVSMSGRAEVVHQPSAVPLPAVQADRGQLEQVLLNLAINARDAMPGGGGRLTISTRPVDLDEAGARMHPGTQPGRYVELVVHDTGIGMSADVRERIFERFFTTKPEGTGTGLGLSTVHGIITNAGGTIEVHSQKGHGTTFRIYLAAVS
jgi:PAS domain S-box-containing protein